MEMQNEREQRDGMNELKQKQKSASIEDDWRMERGRRKQRRKRRQFE